MTQSLHRPPRTLPTSEAERHLSVRPAWKVGDPQQRHADGHGDRTGVASADATFRRGLWSKVSAAFAAASLELGCSWRLTELLSSQLGQVMFEKANKVAKLVSVSHTHTWAKTHKDGGRLTSTNTHHHHVTEYRGRNTLKDSSEGRLALLH